MMNICENIRNLFVFREYENPARIMSMSRSGRWQRTAASVIRSVRPSSAGNTCSHCIHYQCIIGERRGVCGKFTAPNVTLLVGMDDVRTCIDAGSKKCFYSARIRMGRMVRGRYNDMDNS